MKLKVKLNAGAGMAVVILIFTIAYIVGALQLSPPIKDRLPTESSYPWVLIVIMCAACSIVLFKELQKAKRQVVQWKQAKEPLIGIGIIGLYVVLFTYAGYWISTPVFSFGIAMLFEYKRKSKVKALVYPAILAIIIPLIGYLFFEVIFGIRLPGGIWFW